MIWYDKYNVEVNTNDFVWFCDNRAEIPRKIKCQVLWDEDRRQHYLQDEEGNTYAFDTYEELEVILNCKSW